MQIKQNFLPFKNKYLLFIISLSIAFLGWVVVAVVISPQASITIPNIPISTALNDATLKSTGLEIVKQDVEKISVTVEGDRRTIGSLSVADFSVYPVVYGLKGGGEYEFELVVEKTDPIKEFKIIDFSVKKVKMTLDRVAVKTLKIETVVRNLKIEEGYVLGEPFTSPSEKTIRGPEEIINTVEFLQVVVEDTATLKESKTYKGDVQFLDKDRNKIENNGITLESKTVDIIVPVLKKATIPVKVTLLNYPNTVDVNKLTYTLSTTHIELAGPKEKIENLHEISLGYINMAELHDEGQYIFPVELPIGFVNTQNVQTITLNFSNHLLGEKYLSTNTIQILNQPENYDIIVQTKRINNIKLVGDKEQIQGLTRGDLVAEIDFSSIDIIAGESSVPVVIKAVSKDAIWAVGSYHVVIRATPK